MPDYGIPVQKFLVVEALRQYFFSDGTADDRAFIGECQFFRLYEFSAFFKKSRLAALFHIEQHHARVYEIRMYKKFSVVIS